MIGGLSGGTAAARRSVAQAHALWPGAVGLYVAAKNGEKPMTTPLRPSVLVTRKLPEAVEARLMRDYDARLNADDTLYDSERLLAAAQGMDALLICSTEP